MSLYLLTSVVRESFDELDNRAMPTIIMIGPVHNAHVAARQTHSPNSASSLNGLKNMLKLDDVLNQGVCRIQFQFERKISTMNSI